MNKASPARLAVQSGSATALALAARLALGFALIGPAVLAGGSAGALGATGSAGSAGLAREPVFVRAFGGSGRQALGEPSGIAVDPAGHVWVSDAARGLVEEFSATGQPLTSFGGQGTGALRGPGGLAVGPGGDIWVADTGNNRIVEFSPRGTELRAVGSPGDGSSQFDQPADLASAPSGDIYVADSGNGRIEQFSGAGRYLASFATPEPSGVAIGTAGQVWVTSFSYQGGNIVTEFSGSGHQLTSFGSTQAEFGALSNPAGLAVGPDGRIYVAQPDYGLVTVLDSNGDYYTEFGLQGGLAQPGQVHAGQDLAVPQDVAITRAGAVYVAEGGNGQVAEFALAGSAAAAGHRASGPTGTGEPSGPGQVTLRRVGGLPAPIVTAKPESAWVPVLGALIGAVLAVACCGLILLAARRIKRRRTPPDAAEPAQEGAASGQAGAEVSRRALITGAALLTGAAVGAGVLPLALRKRIAAVVASPPLARLSQVEHIVILMQENRSFDHYYGAMPGVRGYADPAAMRLPTGHPVYYQPDASHPQGYLLPFRYDTATTSAQATPGTDHSWPTQHQAWNNGTMDQWIAAKGEFTMGYFTGDDIPFHWALAQAFTICDGYHCSVFGPTNPNRLYMWTGMIDPDGTGGGPVIDNTPAFDNAILSWTTYPERLQRAGISWRVYQEEDNFDDNALAWFKQYANAPTSSPLYQQGLRKLPAGAFEDDARADRLPQVSWLVAPASQSEHPDYLPAAGAEYIAQKLDAIAANPDVWAKTAFILCYDENDGLFDHVAPPTAPAGTPGEFVQAEPIGLGFRVPTTIVSPWTAGGYVCSELFDHTSLIRFIEARFGVAEPNISAWRRQVCGDLTSAFRFSGPAASYPSGNTALRLASAEAGLLAAQQEVNDNPAPVIPAASRPLPR